MIRHCKVLLTFVICQRGWGHGKVVSRCDSFGEVVGLWCDHYAQLQHSLGNRFLCHQCPSFTRDYHFFSDFREAKWGLARGLVSDCFLVVVLPVFCHLTRVEAS